MGTSRINDWLQIFASLSVLAGLVFLALEIRQSNQISIATTEIAVREAYGSSNESVYTNPAFAALLVKARTTDADFSETELEMLDYFFGRMMNIWGGTEEAYANQMVSRKTYEKAFDDMNWTIRAYPGMRPLFQDYVNSYPSSSESELVQELVQYLENN